MALGMSKADIAISKKGIQEYIAMYSNETNKIISTIRGPEYNALVNAIRTAWNGADCENFLEDLRKATQKLENNANNSYANIKKGLTNYQSKWDEMQYSIYKGQGTTQI